MECTMRYIKSLYHPIQADYQHLLILESIRVHVIGAGPTGMSVAWEILRSTDHYKKMLKKDYTPFKTDKKVETRTSSYTSKFHKRYPGVTKLKDISKVTGIPLKTLKTVYDRGLAAWRTGHRPGASPQAWAYARVHSFVVKGKTYYTADKNLR